MVEAITNVQSMILQAAAGSDNRVLSLPEQLEYETAEQIAAKFLELGWVRQIKAAKDRPDARSAQSGQRLPAIELERLITQQLRDYFADSEAIANALPAEHCDAPNRKRALRTVQAIVNTIDKGEEDVTTVVLRPLLARVKVAADRIEIDLAACEINDALLIDDQAMLSKTARSRSITKTKAAPDDQQLIRLMVPARFRRAGHEMKFVVEGAENDRGADPALLRLLTRAHAIARRIANNPSSTLEDISAQEGMGAPYAARLMRLNYLAPEIVIAILNGRQPEGVTATKLIADTRLPLDWSEQRREMDFA